MLWCVSYAFIFLLYIPLILLRIFGCYIPSQFRKKGCLLQAIWGGCELRNDWILRLLVWNSGRSILLFAMASNISCLRGK